MQGNQCEAASINGLQPVSCLHLEYKRAVHFVIGYSNGTVNCVGSYPVPCIIIVALVDIHVVIRHIHDIDRDLYEICLDVICAIFRLFLFLAYVIGDSPLRLVVMNVVSMTGPWRHALGHTL